jgi:hypothetical protein
MSTEENQDGGAQDACPSQQEAATDIRDRRAKSAAEEWRERFLALAATTATTIRGSRDE